MDIFMLRPAAYGSIDGVPEVIFYGRVSNDYSSV